MQEEYNINEVLDSLLNEVDQDHNDTSLALDAYRSVQKKLGLPSGGMLGRDILRWSQRIALLLILPLAVGLVLSLSNLKEEVRWEEVNVRNGSTQTLTLADGTSLVLNAGSRLTYPSSFDGNVREIFIDGEIYADVAHDVKDKPFIVHAGDVSVRVLGTKFGFKAYKGTEEVNVHLLEGSVRLEVNDSHHQSSYTMHPGQSVVYNRQNGTLTSSEFDVAMFRSIRNARQMEFDNMTILDIATELERMFGHRIVVADGKLASRRMTAYFVNEESLEEILNSLNMDDKMNIERDEGVYFLSSRQ